MNTLPCCFALCLAGSLAGSQATAQTLVTPRMGGGQVAAPMIHIDLFFDADSSRLMAHVDDSQGIPELRALEPGYAFDPAAPYAILTGKAYNAQYGWNVGGLFMLPPGAAIWIERIHASPGLETYEGSGQAGSYTPILGTSGSPAAWRWSGVMVHNTYAVLQPRTDRLFADYHVYLGDATTGSPAAFSGLGDTTVHLEWSAVPLEDPLTFRFGAQSDAGPAPLRFLNADEFTTNHGVVLHLQSGSPGPQGATFTSDIGFVAVPATSAHQGPETGHAALQSSVEMEWTTLAGPPGGSLQFWGPDATEPRFALPVGETLGTNRVRITATTTAQDPDPFGRLSGCRITVDSPGLYCVGFRLVDSSTNGPDGGPIHVPSPDYRLHLQAGVTLARLEAGPAGITVHFGGATNRTYRLESSTLLGPSGDWHTVAGPLAGTHRLQSLTDTRPRASTRFYRLRCESTP